MDSSDSAYRCTECRPARIRGRFCYDQCVVSPTDWCTYVDLYDNRLAWSRTDHYMHVLWRAGACPDDTPQEPSEGRFRYTSAGSLLRGGHSRLPAVRDDADQLQANPDRRKSGSLLPVIDYTVGSECDADTEVSVRAENCETSDAESDIVICRGVLTI